MSQTRREFFRNAGRLGVLGLLGFYGGRILRKTSFKPGEICINDSICRGCSVFRGCGLPQALSARRATAKRATRNES